MGGVAFLPRQNANALAADLTQMSTARQRATRGDTSRAASFVETDGVHAGAGRQRGRGDKATIRAAAAPALWYSPPRVPAHRHAQTRRSVARRHRGVLLTPVATAADAVGADGAAGLGDRPRPSTGWAWIAFVCRRRAARLGDALHRRAQGRDGRHRRPLLALSPSVVSRDSSCCSSQARCFLKSPLAAVAVAMLGTAYCAWTIPAEEEYLAATLGEPYRGLLPARQPDVAVVAGVRDAARLTVDIHALYLEAARASRWVWLPLLAGAVNQARRRGGLSCSWRPERFGFGVAVCSQPHRRRPSPCGTLKGAETRNG